ncbi:MAG: phosphate ABC transporter ATP-binding protein [Mycobacteriaceae bacterium]|nr:phosphate ABC transporter ATP-binding protein [Mycobacteriaceae bacterium]
MTAEAVFVFDRVVVERNGLRALDLFTAVVPASGLTAVFGPSGSGKSTMLRLANRLEVPHEGRVLFRGTDISSLDPLELRRRVGMAFQRPTPFPGTVAENLRVADPQASEPQMREVLDRVALTGSWLERDATMLSGGEAQRMCLARTMIARPEVLLLDEPTAAVDAETTRIIEAAVREWADKGMTALWVSHDAAQVQRIADRVLRVDKGRCVGIESVLNSPGSGPVPQ